MNEIEGMKDLKNFIKSEAVKTRFLILIFWLCISVLFCGLSGSFRIPKGSNVDTHALVGYYENGKLMVSDDILRHPGTGVITPESGYWDCKMIGDFFPVLMFNKEKLWAFTDKYSQRWINWQNGKL